MSITFWIPRAPVERVRPYDDEPDYYEVRCVEPFVEVNMTAGNANAILQLISPQDMNALEDPYGEWDQEKLAQVRAACIRALNTKAKEIAYVEPIIDQSPGRCKLFVGGRDSEYVERRLRDFLDLTKAAMDHGFNVVFG